MAVSFSNAEIKVFDIETGQIISTLQGSNDSYGERIWLELLEREILISVASNRWNCKNTD